MSTAVLFEVAGFLLGLLAGSFLNVCISRLPEHRSVVHPRSHCTGCRHLIRWYDNIPLLSWVWLRARCRDCKANISWRYPAVELAVALWFTSAALRLYSVRYMMAIDQWVLVPAKTVQILSFATLGFLLIGLLVMDWETQRLPDAFTLPGIGAGFMLTCVQAWFLAPGEGDVVLNPTHQLRLSSPGSFVAHGNVFLTGTEVMVLGRVAAICGAALILLTVRWIYKAVRGQEGVGLGDVKLLAMIAAFAGFGRSQVALFAGVIVAAAYAAVLIAGRRATAQSKLPFGSFLCAGGLIVALRGQQILGWYMSFWR